MSTVPLVDPNDDDAMNFTRGMYGNSGAAPAKNGAAYAYEQQGRFGGAQPPAQRAPPQQQQQQQQQQAPKVITPVSNGARSENSSSASGENSVRKIGFSIKSEWTAPKKDEKGNLIKDPREVTVHTPLVQALIGEGLDPDEYFNIRRLWMVKNTNHAKSEIGLKIYGVNGSNLEETRHEKEWSSVSMHPENSVDYSHIGDGKLLHENMLDTHGEINSRMSTTAMLAQAVPHPKYPGKVTTTLDLSGFAQAQDERQQLKPLSELGWLVVANNSKKLKNNPMVHPDIRKNLPLTVPAVDLVPEFTIDKTPHVEHSYEAMFDKESLHNMLNEYEIDKSATAQPTSAKEFKIETFRIGAGPNQHIGDLTNELNVTSTDIERSRSMRTGVRAHFVVEIQHPGTPYDPSKASTKK